MNFFTDLLSRVTALSGFFPGAASAAEVGAAVQTLDDAQLLELTELTAQATHLLEHLTLTASAAISTRSSRTAGHSGLAQSHGYRTPSALIQHVTGVSRSTAMQQIRVGAALVEPDTITTQLVSAASLNSPSPGPAEPADPASEPRLCSESHGAAGLLPGAGDANQPANHSDTLIEAAFRQPPWHEPLKLALISGTLSAAQHDAVLRGLGEPPATTITPEHQTRSLAQRSVPPASPSHSGADPADSQAVLPETVQAWSLAAEQLVSYAAEVPVEELAKQARAVRDILDPEGAEARYRARYEARSFRIWTDRDGQSHGSFVFDDESAEWVRTIVNTALRPRRGGPRFVDPAEQAQAATLQQDPRTNDQLAHDLVLDLIKAGSIADARTVFGTRQAGVKLVQVVNREHFFAGTEKPVTQFMESGIVAPRSVADAHRCNTGSRRITVDETGNPLDVGREQRLYTSKQRIALAIRDGGCRWTGCDRPASYCEAHHIDHWGADNGNTDIDRGILLCRFHHMQLHNNGWKITREQQGPFLLHPPPGSGSPKRKPPTTRQTSFLSDIPTLHSPDHPLERAPMQSHNPPQFSAAAHTATAERSERAETPRASEQDRQLRPTGGPEGKAPPKSSSNAQTVAVAAAPTAGTGVGTGTTVAPSTGTGTVTAAVPAAGTGVGTGMGVGTGTTVAPSTGTATATATTAAAGIPGSVAAIAETPAIELRPPLPLTYAWQTATPPAKQFVRAA